jgi:carboxypeptidase family protein
LDRFSVPKEEVMTGRLHRGVVLVCALFAASLSAIPAFAQRDSATVVGVATDPQDRVLPGVTITARNTDTGVTRSDVTAAEGQYRIAALPPGPYELSAALQGFATSMRRGVTLTLGAEAVINFSLTLSTITEQVVVTADAPVVETTTAAVQAAMTREQIDLLPLIGRDYASLLRIMPGAVSNNSSYSFTGSRGRSNQFQFDGVDNSSDISGYERTEPALDSLQEFQVLVNNYKAEYGRASGGVINAITRSGTNQFHGSGFFLFRNDSMMAKSPYADVVDPFQRVHYGGAFGGPLRQDRRHFFLNYERQDRDTFSADTYTLPSGTASFAPAVRQFLASNGIDVGIFGEGGRRRLTRPEYVDQHKVTAKLDNQINSNQALTLRYTLEHLNEPSGTGGTIYDFQGNTAFSRDNFVLANHKWIVAADKLNELYLSIGQGFFDGFVHYPELPRVNITGGPTIGGTTDYPQRRTDYVYQVVDNFTWSRVGTRTGDHNLRTGADIKIFRSNGFFDSNFRGTFTFPTLQRFLEGRPQRFTQQRGDSNLARPNELYSFYVQDDWRLNRALTLNLGLRYDYETGRVEALRAINGRPGPGTSEDRNNLGPRIGFVWAPGGSTRHAIYGGSGLYYDQVILNVQGNARFTPPKVISLQIDNPAFPDPFLGGTVSFPPPSLNIIDDNLVTPRNWNSSIGYRRELLRDLGLDVSFVYNRGWDQVATININAGRPGSADILGTGAVRPDPTATSKTLYTNRGDIWYKGLLVDVTKRLNRGVQGGVAYTLSKTEDTSFNFLSSLQVPTNPELSKGPGNDDRRHVLSTHAEINLPWDVQFATIVEFRTERPLDITAGSRDVNGDGITGDWVNQSICVNIQCSGFAYSRNSVREMRTEEANRLRALFGLGPIAEYEDNPKYVRMDATLQRRFRISGDRAFRVTFEAFNVFNTPTRERPSQNITSSLFGAVTSVDQMRAIQFTLQYDF